MLKERLNNNFDFLRLSAALFITFTHSYNLIGMSSDEPLMKVTNNHYDFSFIGLSIFFSISGFLVTKSAVTSPSFKNYLWKRFLRIQPMLGLVCILSIFLVGPIFSLLSTRAYFKDFTTYSYFRNVIPLFGVQFTLPQVFTKNVAENGINGSLWTLIVEERLYLFLGLIFLFRYYGKKIILFITIILNIIYFLPAMFLNTRIVQYFDSAAVFYALIFLNSGIIYLTKIDFFKFSKSILGFIFTIILYLLLFILDKSILIILLPFTVILIAHLKGFTNKVGKWGDFTFGIYAFSFPIQQILIAVKLTLNNPLKLFLLTLMIVFPMAILTWHLMEKKMIALKNNII